MTILKEKEMMILDILLKGKSNYQIYPTEIEILSNNKISRAGAKPICERLVKAGILHVKNKPTKIKRRQTPHYYLGKDKESFTKLVRSYFQTLIKSDHFSWQTNTNIFMSSNYAVSLINSNLVRKVLSSKVIIVQDNMSDDQKKDIEKIAMNYSKIIKKKDTILPILALIQISPTALEYFLSDWKPYTGDENNVLFSFTSYGYDMIEHVLFRLVWNTINDLSLIRKIHNNSFVLLVSVSGGRFPKPKSFSLLHLDCKECYSIEYEAGFDNIHEHRRYDGKKFVHIEKINPENGRVKITLKKEIPRN